ncbi:MAG: AtpZ/AtpI family protein [Chloroflexi bacterium]|nr:AtpZ/AtpI family protein [Chloroflexota bacterium]
MVKNDEKKKDRVWRAALSAINLGWEMALPIFLGVLLGNYLDMLTESRFNLTISLLVFGIFISFYNYSRIIKKFDQKDENNDKDE